MKPARQALAVVALGATLAGCGVGHSSLGTASSPCFRALPIATAAVHNRGRLVGVRLVSSATANAVLIGKPAIEPAPDATASTTPPSSRACLVAYRGSFTAGSVDHEGLGSLKAGRYAIVAVSLRPRSLFGAVIVDRLNVRFEHA